MRWHDLRHTFASMLISQGHNVAFIARQLGHADPNVTLGTYSHLFDQREHGERMSSDLEAAYGNMLETSGGDRGPNRLGSRTPKVAQLRRSENGGA